MKLQRRDMLQVSAGAVAAGLVGCSCSATSAQSSSMTTGSMAPYARQTGLCVFPGVWRPWFEWEHIAWVRTPWSDPLFPDCVWLDFPEAIFSNEGLWFLSHINPGIAIEYPKELPATQWRHLPDGVAYSRRLPRGLSFSGKLVWRDETAIDYELSFENRSDANITNITLQTCCFLKPSAMFSQNTQDNKFVHVAAQGWVTLAQAAKLEPAGRYSVGWRGGPKVADSPWVLTKSADEQHWVGMTWFEDTLSFIGNPTHPCVHADPLVGDVKPGQKKTIKGRLAFFTGKDPQQFSLPLTLSE